MQVWCTVSHRAEWRFFEQPYEERPDGSDKSCAALCRNVERRTLFGAVRDVDKMVDRHTGRALPPPLGLGRTGQALADIRTQLEGRPLNVRSLLGASLAGWVTLGVGAVQAAFAVDVFGPSSLSGWVTAGCAMGLLAGAAVQYRHLQRAAGWENQLLHLLNLEAQAHRPHAPGEGDALLQQSLQVRHALQDAPDDLVRFARSVHRHMLGLVETHHAGMPNTGPDSHGLSRAYRAGDDETTLARWAAKAA